MNEQVKEANRRLRLRRMIYTVPTQPTNLIDEVCAFIESIPLDTLDRWEQELYGEQF